MEYWKTSRKRSLLNTSFRIISKLIGFAKRKTKDKNNTKKIQTKLDVSPGWKSILRI